MLVRLGAISAFLAVAAGAFGAHFLESRLDLRQLHNFEVGVRYQMYHALALLLVGALERRLGVPAIAAGWLFLVGTLVFSGSLYVLALSGVTWCGAVTPVGGVALLIGWAVLAFGVTARRVKRRW